MKDLTKILSKIKAMPQDELKTQDLYAEGLNNYYITKLIKDDVLERVKKGYYRFKRSDIQPKTIFNNFSQRVKKKRYEEAYEKLKTCIDIKESKDHDNHYFLFLILIQNLINPKMFDERLFDKVPYYLDSTEPESEIYRYYKAFTENILNHNFIAAYKNLKNYIDLEIKIKNERSISTILFNNLLLAIINKNIVQNKSESSTKDKQNANIITVNIEKRRIPTFIKLEEYKKIYSNLQKALEEDNYKKSIEYLEKLLLNAPQNLVPEIEKLRPLINMYHDMLKNDQILSPNDYSSYEEDHQIIYEDAIKNQDYITAFLHIQYVMNQTEQVSIYQLAYIILEKIHSLNDQKLLMQSEKEKILSYKYTQEELYDLIYNRQYNEVRKLITYFYSQSKDTPRIYHFTIVLLSFLEKIEQIDFYYKVPNVAYKNDRDDIFKYFFEALKNKDYFTAYDVVKDIEEIVSRRPNQDLEFTIYKYILEDVCEAINQYLLKHEKEEKLNIINNKIKQLIISPSLNTDGNLITLKNILIERIKLSQEMLIEPSIHDYSLISLIEIIQILKNQSGSITDYFQTFDLDSTENNIIKRFHFAIVNGDYATAFAIINDENLLNRTKADPNRLYYTAYKKLLWKLNNQLESKKEIEPLDNADIPEDEKEENLQTLILYIKKRDYISAYNLYNEKKSYISDQIKTYADVLLKFMYKQDLKNYQELLNTFKRNYNQGNYKKAKSDLAEFQEYTAGKPINKNLDYYNERISLESIRINKPNYVRLEQLYDLALYKIQQSDYLGCISVLDEYISLDENLSAKGYLLRGNAYVFLGENEKAKDDYLKAISISHEPLAYYNLGKILNNENEKESMKYYHEYEERNIEDLAQQTLKLNI